MQDTTDPSGLATELATKARDAAYVAVGLGLLGLQRAQVRRHELSTAAARAGQDDERLTQLRSAVAAGAKQLGQWADATAQMVSATLAPLEAQLPEPAREVAGKARTQLCAIGAQLRQVTSSVR